MRLKNFFQIIGFRGKSKKYLYTINKFDLNNDIQVKYAQWNHPSESQKIISEDQVNAYRKIL